MGRVDGGGDVWREREVRVSCNPGKTRPKHKIGDTYGRGETRRSSGSRWRRGLRSGVEDSPAAVGSFERVREKGEGEGVQLGFIGGRLWLTRKGSEAR